MAMTELEYVQRRIRKLRRFLLSNEPVTTISVAGLSVTFDRAGAVVELKMLERRERDLLQPGRRYKSIDLSSAW